MLSMAMLDIVPAWDAREFRGAKGGIPPLPNLAGTRPVA
jgi:hypothetical protein